MMNMCKFLTLIAGVAMWVSCSSGGNGLVGVDSELIAVKQGSKWGFVNHKGEYVINPQFSSVSFFTDGVAVVNMGNYGDEKFGLIDEDGKYVVNPMYAEAALFSDGCVWMVKPDCAPELVDNSGKVLFTYKKGREFHSFREGLAVVEGDGGKEWVIDKNGKTVFELQDNYSFESDFFDGLAVVKEHGNRGYVNNNGKLVINCQFDEARPFVNGKAIVCSNDQYGVIDKKGKYVINPQFQEMIEDNGKYVILMGTQFGWCDGKGKIVINPQFDRALLFGNSDLAPVCSGDKWGFIDKNGKYVINPQFDYALPFNGDVAIVLQGDKFGLINKDGNFVANPQFDDVGSPLVLEDLFKRAVTSQYFDVEGAVSHIASLFSGNKFNGMKISETSISLFRQKYNLSDRAIQAECRYSRDLKYTITAHGTFTQEVSDGWWGTEIQDIPYAKIDYLSLNISLSKKSKTGEVAKGLANALQVKDGRSASGMYVQFVQDINSSNGEFRSLIMNVSDKPIKK